jgi:hypothetical protein
MKTKTINIYNIHELSEKAQEKAHSDYLNNGFEYFWLDESSDSIRAFCDMFGVTLTDWALTTYGHSYLKTDATQETFRGVKPSDIPTLDAMEKWPTGYCMDETLFSAFHEYAAKHGDTKGAFDHAIDKALDMIIADMQYQESFEYFLDMAEANEWEYLEDGSSAWRCAA